MVPTASRSVLIDYLIDLSTFAQGRLRMNTAIIAMLIFRIATRIINITLLITISYQHVTVTATHTDSYKNALLI